MTDEPEYVTDAEIIRRLKVPEKIMRPVLREWDRRPGCPKKRKVFGDRRFWPAVKAYLYAIEMPSLPTGADRLATENRDRTRLPRPPLAVVPMRRNHE